MKKYIRLISILLILWITGCNKFLDVTPKNVISMDDLQSIKQALSGFLNGMRVDGGNSYNFENPVSPLEPSNREGVLLAYCEEWDLSELAADNEGMTVEDIKKVDWRDETTQGYWGRFYQTIGFMNLILHEAETATGDEDMRDYIMGEAYVMRAYCFFKLVQYYAPYDNNDLGIPLCLNSYDDFEDVNLSRAPQTKVYAQILSDLHEAEIRLERTPMRNGFNVMYKSSVLNRLFAQVYQFKALSPAAEANDWQNAALYASKETRNATLDGIDVLYSIFSVNNTKEVMNNETALRIFFSMGYPKSSMFNGMELSTDFYESYFSRTLVTQLCQEIRVCANMPVPIHLVYHLQNNKSNLFFAYPNWLLLSLLLYKVSSAFWRFNISSASSTLPSFSNRMARLLAAIFDIG